MRIRSLLLAGTVLPFALTYAALAEERTSAPSFVLAQAEPCPEGQECPPPAEQPPAEEPAAEPAPEAPPAEPAPEAPPAEPAPEAPAAEPAPEASAAEQPAQEAPAEPAPEAPAAEEAAPEQPAAEQAPAEQPAAEQPAEPAPEQPAAEPPAAEPAPEAPAVEAAPEQPAEEVPAEQPAAEQPAEPAAEAAPEQPAVQDAAPAEGDAVERARRRQQELEQQQQGGAPAPKQPAAEAAPAAPPAEPVPEAEATADTPPAAIETTVEQQLEAQGDEEEARRVRTLRGRLLDELRAADEAAPDDEEEDDEEQAADDDDDDEDGNRRGDRRRGDRRDRDRDGDYGWWDRDRDEGEVVDRRGTRIIIDLGGGNLFVRPLVPDEGGRLLYGAEDVEVQNLPRGRTRTIVYRDNGVEIITVRDRYGDIVSRTKRLPNGREIVLIDNRFPEDYAGGPPPILDDLPPLVINIPEDEYIVDLGDASDEDIRGALLAPPVQEIERAYTLDEVLRNEQVRAYSPRIDLDTITFEFGSATIGNDQMDSLFALGEAMESVIAENPAEVYLIEGHTDAVGSDYDNLILSDQRAEAVATALAQNFDIPPENLVTEGYGEQYLKVETEGPEEQNRRATVRRLTELLQAQNQ